jgi:alpha-D-xyloside xylohydrolase
MILPMGPVIQSTTEASGKRIELHVFPGRDGEFELYEDDGISNRYEAGQSSRIPMRWDDRRGELLLGARRGSFPGMPADRVFFVHRVEPGNMPFDANAGVRVAYSGRQARVSLA